MGKLREHYVHSRLRRRSALVAVFAVLSLLFSGLVVVSPWTEAAPAQAAALAACDGTSTQNGLTVAAGHGKVFYIDSGVTPALDAAYAGYRVTNSGSARTNLWVSLQSFSGGIVALAHPSDQDQQIASLANGATSATYFLLKALGASSTSQGHIVRVYDRDPHLAGAAVLYSCSFTFVKVAETIKAAANKVTSVTLSNSSPQLGQTTTITVVGEGGTIGAGQAPDGSIVWLTPAAYSSWPTRALRLESTTVDFGKNGQNGFSACNNKSYTNQLIVGDAKTTLGANCSDYRAQYTFRVTGRTLSAVTISPVAQIASGQRIKHTDIGGSSSGSINLSGVVNPLSATKTVTSTTNLTETVVGGTTYVEVPYRITVSSTSSTQSVVDEIVDTPAVGASIVPGSVRITDVNDSGTVGSDPTYMTSEAALSPRPLHFTGPFEVTSAKPVQISYRMYIPKATGAYVNEAYATSGDTVIGSGASFQQQTTVTTDGSGGVTTRDDTVQSDPTVSTQNASAITISGAMLNAIVDGNGNSPAATFEYSTSASFNPKTTVSASPSPVTGTDPTAVSATLTGLSSGTTYHFRALAGSVVGSTLTFNTPEVVANPTAITDPVTGITATGGGKFTVTLNGAVDANQTSTSVYFRYGTCPSIGGSTEVANNPVDVLISAYASAISYDLTSLTSGTYCYRVVGKYGASSEVLGAIVSFTTGTAQTITFNAISDSLVTAADFTATATTTASGLTPTLTSDTPTICSVTGTTVDVLATGTCSITATQGGGSSGGVTYASADPVTQTFRVVDPVAITTPSPLTSGSANVSYSGVTFAASGGSGSYATWNVTSGSLPTGLTLDTSAGILYGTPSVSGTSTFTLQVTDSLGFTATKDFTLTVVDAPTITTSSPLSAGSRNVAYAGVTLAASGGSGTYSSWTVTSGSLPAGLTLNAGSGAISGTPTASGTSTFTVRVTDSLGGTATKEFNLTVHDPPTITTSSLAGGQTSTAYQQTVSASGGVAPYSWSKQSGDLPPGVTLTDDSLSGTPTSAGTYTFTIKVTDSLGGTDTKSLSITVSGPLSIQTLTLADGAVNESYSQTIEAAGGTAPYSQWSVSAGALPGGLTLSSQGVLSGTPTTEGSSTFTVQVRDAANATATRQYTVAIAGAPDATTLDDSSATTVSAVFKGRINPKGGSNTSTSFEYSRVSDLSSGVVTVPGRSGLSGNAAIDEEVTVNGLTPYTLYYYRIKASNARGTAMGAIKSLRTSPGSPLATTDDSSSVTSSGAVLTGTVRARGPLAQIRFDYSTTLDLSSGVTTATSATTATDNADTPGSVTLTGLDPYTTYYFRTRGTSDYGDDTGVIKSFRTEPGTPIATTDDTGAVDSTSAVLRGTVKARGPEAVFHFDLSKDDPTFGNSADDTTVNGNVIATNNTDTPDSVTVSGLEPYTTYYYRVRGVSQAHGSGTGGIKSFRTGPGKPVATTLDDSSVIDDTTIQVRGNVRARGAAATVVYEYRRGNPDLGTPDGTASAANVGPDGDQTESITIPGLRPGNTYYYRVRGSNAQGTAHGAVKSIRIPPGRPKATTMAPVTVTSTTAIIEGSVNAWGGSNGRARFRWSESSFASGASANRVSRSVFIRAAQESSNVTVTGTDDSATTYTLTGLTPSTTYFYEVRITTTRDSGDDTANGGVLSFTTAAANAPAIDTAATPDGTVGRSYSLTFVASGGSGVYSSWAISGGSLPNGLTLNAASGALTGTPSVAGTSNFTVQVTDSASATATRSYTLVVRAAPAITTASLASGTVGVAYSATTVATGGTSPLTWSLVTPNNVLPAGLTWNAATQTISGTPTADGSANVDVRVTDANGATDTKNYTIVIAPAASPTITTAALPDGTVGTGYSATVSASGGTAPYTWSMVAPNDVLPVGLTWNAGTRSITGTPTTAGTTSVTFRVTDAQAQVDTKALTITITAAGGGGGGQRSQVITFPKPEDRFIDESPGALGATASSGLPVRYTTSTPDACGLTGTSVDLVAPGTCRITAHQDGNSTWLPADAVTRSFDISKRPQVIRLPGIRTQLLTPIRFPVEVTNADATSSRDARSIAGRLPETTITLTSVTPRICRVSDDIISLRAVGDCTLRAYSEGSHIYLEAERDITFPVTEADLLVAVEPQPITVRTPPLPAGWTYQADDTPAGISDVTIKDDRILVTPTTGATGTATVRISAVTAGREPVTSEVRVTFRPQGAGPGTFTPTAAHRTGFTWRPSSTSSVTGYAVEVDGRLVCRTATTTCVGNLLVGPGSEVRVIALGTQGVRSDGRRLTYLAAEPVLVTTIYFDVDRETLDRQAKKRLTKLAKIIREEAFRRLLVEGHTDSVSSENYNQRLSQRRIDSAVEFLQRRLRDLNISERALGELFPAGSNATSYGRAMNRRVEISVW